MAKHQYPSAQCNDCGHEIVRGGATALVSGLIGEVYRGPEICDECADRRYEDAWAQHDNRRIAGEES